MHFQFNLMLDGVTWGTTLPTQVSNVPGQPFHPQSDQNSVETFSGLIQDLTTKGSEQKVSGRADYLVPAGRGES